MIDPKTDPNTVYPNTVYERRWWTLAVLCLSLIIVRWGRRLLRLSYAVAT